MNYEQLMKSARQTNAQRDKIDQEYGVATPLESGFRSFLFTVMAALEAGIRTEDWNCIAEGLAMLEEWKIKKC